ncbi:unnamed protein product [Discula destructiva]
MNNEANCDMDEKVDEGDVFISQQQEAQVKRPVLQRLAAIFAKLYPSRVRKGSSAKLLEGTDEPELEDIDLTHPPSRQRNAGFRRNYLPSGRSFILAAVFFALGVGIGCTLGLSIPYSPSLVQVLTNLVGDKPTVAAEPRLDAFGVPDTLPVISPASRLTNTTELDLKTGFVVSRTPTVREYEFNISHALAAPDGVWKTMILANGQSPGPLIEASTGDTVRVRVNNLMPNTSTTIHWHGINQYNSTWMDGVAGVSQCGIPPGGGSWTYEFVLAGQRGTFWWHAHAGVQFSDGLFGPIVIHDPDEMVPKTDDDKIVFLGENYHSFAAELLSHYLAPTSPWDPTEAGVEPLADSLLLNGQHTFSCAVQSTTFTPSAQPNDTTTTTTTPLCTGGALYTTTVTPGSTTRLRLINHSSFFSYWFRIDGHTLTLVEIDGVEIAPLAVDGVHVNIGQRYSVLVTANHTVGGNDGGGGGGGGGEFAIRSALERECFLPFATYNSSGLESVGYEARGVLRYEGSATHAAAEGVPAPEETTTTTAVALDETYTNGNPRLCLDLRFDAPAPKRAEAAYPLSATDPQFIVDFEFRQVGAVNRIFLNRTSWAPYGDDATLWQAMGQDFDDAEGGGGGGGGAYHSWGFRLDQQVLLVPEGSGSVQVVVNSLDVMEHPFHMHGHTVQIVGWGPGRYIPGTAPTTTWNLENPMRRDTFTVPEQSHVVVRFRADNPGVWILHCHVAWHLEAGMAALFLERPEDLKSLVGGMDEDTRILGQSFCAKRQLGQDGLGN